MTSPTPTPSAVAPAALNAQVLMLARAASAELANAHRSLGIDEVFACNAIGRALSSLRGLQETSAALARQIAAPDAVLAEAELMALIRAAADGASISISRVGGRHWGVSLERHQPGAYRFWGTAPGLHAAIAQCLEEAAKHGWVIKAQP